MSYLPYSREQPRYGIMLPANQQQPFPTGGIKAYAP